MSRNNLHWLEMIKRGDWWRSQMPVSMTALSLAMGKSESYIQAALNPDHPMESDNLIVSLEKVIPDIENRKLCFPKPTIGPAISGTIRPPKFMWLDPQPCLIPKLGMAWSLWAECQTCRGNQFLPVLIDNKEHYACFHCLHPTQYRAIGATEVKKSLIHEALKQYY